MTTQVQTSQNALLERPLTWMRTRKILPFVSGKKVLDFGCGDHMTTLRSLHDNLELAAGYDIKFSGSKPYTTADGIKVYGAIDDIKEKFDVILSLACFEHIYPEQLPPILHELKNRLSNGGMIAGTVPTPPARPVLEFLSYKLGLIDPSQIRDHKVYYSKKRLKEVVNKAGWELVSYRRFQLGMNSFFTLRPQA